MRTDARHCDACELVRTERDSRPVAGEMVDGRYRIVGAVGRGGFGVVYRAEDVHLKRYVAIKIAHEDAIDRIEGVSFESEAAALAAIRHPNVVGVHAFGMHGGVPFFAMEHVAGASLEKSLRAHRDHGAHVPMHTALHVVQQIARGLGAAHAVGLVHRDVKPDNVLIEEHTGRPVLVDFGIAVSSKRSIRQVVGTPAYMAPEATSTGERVGPASDQYSLACMAYELMTGGRPFVGSNDVGTLGMHAEAPRPRASERRPELASADDVLARGMAIDPAARWGSCVAFADALAEVSRALVPPPGTEAPAPFTLTSRRVLVVEDDPVAVKLISRAAAVAFMDGDVAISRARTGPDAVANAERSLPSLVVLDYHLPGIDGVEVLSRIRAMPGGERVAVLVVSGNVGASERWRFSILGVQNFVDKPIDFARCVESIATIARRRGWILGNTASSTMPGGRP